MIEVSFDLYNEEDLDSSHVRRFSSIEEARKWFNSQSGHPYLTYRNERVKVGEKYISLWRF